MYFRESVSIASNQPDLAEVIERLDQFLYLNQGDTVRLVRIAAILDIDDEQADDLLGLLETEGVVTRCEVAVCPDCDAVIEASGAEMECDLCERQFSDGEWEVETGFVPRHTQFESGDELSNDRKAADHVDGIFRIIGCSNADRTADVVFVHGLDGDATTTWHPKDKPDDYWPKWIGEDIPQAGVWSVDYEARSLKWQGNALPLTDRAMSCLNKLVLAGIGQRPFVFVTHSLGGLLAKQVLRHAKELGGNNWEQFSEYCRAVVFLATPHSGSDLSGYVQYLKYVLRPTEAVTDLEAHDPRLRELNVWYRNNVASMGIETAVFYETQKTAKIMVVDQTSADPGVAGVVPIPVETNHIEICKPPTRGHEVYVGCKQLVERVIESE